MKKNRTLQYRSENVVKKYFLMCFFKNGKNVYKVHKNVYIQSYLSNHFQSLLI